PIGSGTNFIFPAASHRLRKSQKILTCSMCYYTEQKETLKKVAARFKAKADNPQQFLQSDYIVGFEFLNLPIIKNVSPDIITTDFTWGLIPLGKDTDFRKNTLNARIETLESKPSF